MAENIYWMQSKISKVKLDAEAHITKFKLITNFCRINFIFLNFCFRLVDIEAVTISTIIAQVWKYLKLVSPKVEPQSSVFTVD